MNKMNKILIGAVVSAAAVAALRRFGPAMQPRAVSRCHQMMGGCGDMSGRHAGSPAGTAGADTAARGSGRAAAAGPPAQAAAAR